MFFLSFRERGEEGGGRWHLFAAWSGSSKFKVLLTKREGQWHLLNFPVCSNEGGWWWCGDGGGR